MEFKIDKNLFIKSINKVLFSSGDKDSINILRNVKIDAIKDNLILTCTDHDSTIRVSIEAEIIKEGSITVEVKILFNIIKKIKETLFKFSIDQENNFVLHTEKGVYTFPTLPSYDFPRSSFNRETEILEIESHIFREMIKKISFILPKGKVYKPELTKALIEFDKEGSINIICCDGRRLGKISDRQKNYKIDEKKYLISQKAFTTIKNLLDDTEDDKTIQISFGFNKALFIINDVKMLCSLSNETYPDYNKTIPKNNNNTIVLNRLELLNIVLRMSSLTKADNNTIIFNLNSLTSSLETPEECYAKGYEELNCEWESDDLLIGLNGIHLISIINHINSEKITMLFDDSTTTVILFPEPVVERDDLFYLLVPVRI